MSDGDSRAQRDAGADEHEEKSVDPAERQLLGISLDFEQKLTKITKKCGNL